MDLRATRKSSFFFFFFFVCVCVCVGGGGGGVDPFYGPHVKLRANNGAFC